MSEATLTQPKVTYVRAGPDITCNKCGVVFWVTKQLNDARREDHGTFYCPNGHDLYWPQENEAERYKRLYRNAKDQTAAVSAERDQAEAGRRAWKGQATKLRKRVLDGTCPICGETVAHLVRHVSRKHPDERIEETA